MQKQEDNTWNPISYRTRILIETKKKQKTKKNTDKKETLSAMWACDELSSYLGILKFKFGTDHKPLSLLGFRGINELSQWIDEFQSMYVKVYINNQACIVIDCCIH